MKNFIYIFLLLYATTASAQTDSGFVNYACGLFSPFQIDIERLLEERKNETKKSFIGGDVLEIKSELGSYSCNRVSNSIYLALNFSTGNYDLRKVQRPLNICIVLDRSGSMQENGRMNKLKEGLKEFVKLLSPQDYVSIVVYDDNPLVLIPSRNKGSIFDINNIIDEISLGGGTNIWGGMLAGYKEIEKKINVDYVNKLILMTDGMSNVGIRSTKEILEKSKIYNDKGIETSTMGLGKDINFELLSQLAQQGKGLSHFIGDCENSHNDISSSLKEEYYSFYPVAKNIYLKFVLPKNIYLVEAYGITDSEVNKSAEVIHIKDMGVNKDKVVLLKFDINGIPGDPSVYIQTEIEYTNGITDNKETVKISDRVIFNKKAKNAVDILSNESVYNYHKIVYIANNIKTALKLQRSDKNKEARDLINKSLRELELEKLPESFNFKYIHGILRDQKRHLDIILK